MKAFEDARRLFMEGKPYAERRVTANDRREHVFIWENYTPTPETFGLIAGDAIHNLRSSLDHLAVGLANAGADKQGVVMTPEEVATIQFPIVKAESEFVKQSKKLLYVDPQAIAYIKSVQPYVRLPANPERAPLRVLSDLDNADKHRLITTAALVPIMMKVSWPPDIKDTQTEYPQGDPSNEVGAEICRYRFVTPQLEVDVPVEFGWGTALWLGFGWANADITVVLQQYIREVRNIVWDLSFNFIQPFGVVPVGEI